jgi:hypothetical protein
MIFDDIHHRRSQDYCRRYSHYAMFAVLPLNIAVNRSGKYPMCSFQQALIWSTNAPYSTAKLADYINSLDFDEKGAFTIYDYQFYSEIRTEYGPDLSESQVETDIRDLTDEKQNGKNMLKSHAEMMLKAAMFWKLHYKEKFEQWLREYQDVIYAELEERCPEGSSFLSTGQAGSSMRRNYDEGYVSGDLSDEESLDWDSTDEA